MVKFIDMYDMFEVGETWYTKKSEEIFIDERKEFVFFEGKSEVIIDEINREEGYGYAMVQIEGNVTKLQLDELYDMVFE